MGAKSERQHLQTSTHRMTGGRITFCYRQVIPAS